MSSASGVSSGAPAPTFVLTDASAGSQETTAEAGSGAGQTTQPEPQAPKAALADLPTSKIPSNQPEPERGRQKGVLSVT
jgi:hypothetical protein